jgi:hypothetical protein
MILPPGLHVPLRIRMSYAFVLTWRIVQGFCTVASKPFIEVMDMPRTREQLQQAAEAAERWLDSLDPAAIASPDADASRLRRIGDAVRAVARSQVELADAVAEARVHGHTWTQIAAMLGTSRQAAQERYGEPAERR